jgi:hypothetical protein
VAPRAPRMAGCAHAHGARFGAAACRAALVRCMQGDGCTWLTVVDRWVIH